MKYVYFNLCFFFCKQKTAYVLRFSDWSSDVCSSDLSRTSSGPPDERKAAPQMRCSLSMNSSGYCIATLRSFAVLRATLARRRAYFQTRRAETTAGLRPVCPAQPCRKDGAAVSPPRRRPGQPSPSSSSPASPSGQQRYSCDLSRSEAHTSELPTLLRKPY